MPNYRRSLVAGGSYVFTVVAFHRLPILTTDERRSILHTAWNDVQRRFPFTTTAVCLLPEHLHCIWSLPEQDADYPLRWKEIKRLFTRSYLERAGPGEKRNQSRIHKGEAAIWQRRYWEHLIRDDADMRQHIDYIHYNPVKHGLVKRAADWPWSSFQRYVKMGYYEPDWGGAVEAHVHAKEMACGE